MSQDDKTVWELEDDIAELQAELRVYQDMQANLNTNLANYPEMLDTLEALQCSVYPADKIPRLVGDYTDNLEYALKKCHNAYLELATETEDYRDSCKKWRKAHQQLERENKMLRKHIGLQHIRLGKDCQTISLQAHRIHTLQYMLESYA